VLFRKKERMLSASFLVTSTSLSSSSSSPSSPLTLKRQRKDNRIQFNFYAFTFTLWFCIGRHGTLMVRQMSESKLRMGFLSPPEASENSLTPRRGTSASTCGIVIVIDSFLARDSIHAERAICYRPSVCASVCLSHRWIS